MDQRREKVTAAASIRRKLQYGNFEEILEDIRRIQSRPHRNVGNWTLAQACKHLADTFHASIDGIRLGGHRLRRFFLGRKILGWTFKNGIPPGVTVDEKLTPPPSCEMAESFRELEAAIRRYTAHTGKLKPHPIFGRLSRPDWDRLHCFHCAHHLSFIVESSLESEDPKRT